MQIFILHNRHEGDKLNYQYDVTIYDKHALQ
jgi:hypothetical protein